MKENTSISQCDGRDLVHFLTLLGLTAISFKLSGQKSQLYRKQQFKMTTVLRNSAKQFSLLPIQLHFPKLLVEIEKS